jgi:hypothetical protein|nr:MAG TPA: hypothetical protein [Caudoviricetes sp.]
MTTANERRKLTLVYITRQNPATPQDIKGAVKVSFKI